MCTAATYITKDFYFGRNLDLGYSYCESVTVTPRNFPFKFRMSDKLDSHYAMVGMAYVEQGYPLYYEATNEKGLCVAGLNFPGNAVYNPPVHGKENIAPFELIPYLLGKCSSLSQARKLLDGINLVNINFRDELPLSPLHWIIADRSGAITVESVKDGMKIYENPLGILTNNPTFDFHMTNLSNYINLSPNEPTNRFADKADISSYCLGMGAIGLPGDLSSASRFVRAAFTKANSISGNSESESISQFFHILGSVNQVRGTVRNGDELEITVYSCCCNADKGIYYYKTYENSQISAVDMHREKLDGGELASYPLITGQQIRFQN